MACACSGGCAEPLPSRPADPPSDAGTDADAGLSFDDTDACRAAAEEKTSYGCDFFGLRVDTQYGGGCFAMMVANAADVAAHLTVDRGGQAFPVSDFARIPKGQGASLELEAYDADLGLPPGEVAILFLSHAPGESTEVFAPPCPVTPAVPGDPPVLGTRRGEAFRLRTDVPVSAYQMFPFGGGMAAETSATLLLPTHVWDRDYVAVNAYPAAYHGAPPTLAIVGLEHGTELTLTPVVDVLDGKPIAGTYVPGTPKGVARTYALGAGEYLQLTQKEELTGSRIKSSKPVGVYGGSTCMNVAANTCCCDTAQQQIPPLGAMGTEYVGVRHRDRMGESEVVPWRIIGAADGTQLEYEPAAPDGAPATLSRGQVAEFWAPGPFVVRSQGSTHPFYVGAYMTGGADHGVGDAEWVNVTPAAQYLNSYAFFTDPTYPETSLVVIRARNDGGSFSDVELECMGKVTGWQAVGSYEYAWVTLVTGNFESVGGCANGAHRMQSEGPFGVTIWGWGSPATGGSYPEPSYTRWVSYAYPAAAGMLTISEVPK
jgi:hypothetical protein